MTKEEILSILDSGVQAPSGENCQPWSFEVSLNTNTVFLYNVPERDISTYNFNQQGSLISHGCVIENIDIKAISIGYKTDITLFPDPDKETLVAKIVFLKDQNRKKDDLNDSIYNRTTNRKPYKDIPLTTIEKNLLLSEVKLPANLVLVDEKEKLGTIAGCLSASEQVLFENKTMHDFFFSHINWTLADEEKKRIGFYIKTLELTPPQQKGFSLFKNWKVLSILNLVGVSKVVRKDNTKLYSTAAALGFILYPEESKEGYVIVGRVVERLWLCATKLGLSFHPLNGVILIEKKVRSGEAHELSLKQQKLITNAYITIQNNITASLPIQFGFRIGRAEAPSAHSLRQSPQINFI